MTEMEAALAEREAIPKKFLENILLALKLRGLVHSRKGPHGGYQLGRAPSQISVGDIVRALDGPLALDNAISVEAAEIKHIVSPVAGQADILLVPDLEAGNMLAKQLTFLGGADAAGVVLGARVPIILTSRADDERTRIASAAIAVLLATSPTWAAAQGHPAE